MTLMAEVAEAAPGFYLTTTDRGFSLHISASAPHLRQLRDQVGKTLALAGVTAETVELVQLVASELVGNAVRACGDHVPLVVEVAAGRGGVPVNVHDPETGRLPRRRAVALDDERAETGRGLALVDCSRRTGR
jgi:anti-sigma regulatory factor (Ser/Thr protein kinase)